jgi:peptide chain release factor 1
MFDKLQTLVERYNEIERLFAQPDVASDVGRLSRLAKERAELTPVVQAYQRYQHGQRAIEEARQLAGSPDPELAELAKEELPLLLERGASLERDLKHALVPRDPHGERNAIVEVRSGTGGDEASLFAADLYRMYVRFAQRKGWKVDMVDTSEGSLHGIKEVIFEVAGRGAYQHLKHESGVHRVQRVPLTEAQGRIHTSTATVAVLPEAEEVDVQVKPEDLRIDIFHASGAGGQNVNKVSTAVRIVHLPTGIVAVCQDERSQLKNRQKAMTVLRSRLLERELQAQQAQASATRRAQVGSGDRSEKIRTYNFPQDRLTDHRVGLTVHGLEAILDGELDSIIQALMDKEQAQLLQEAVA